jgi:hypothetical protein
MKHTLILSSHSLNASRPIRSKKVLTSGISARIRLDFKEEYGSVWELVLCLVEGGRWCGERILEDGDMDEDLVGVVVVDIGLDGWKGNVGGAWFGAGMVVGGKSTKLIVSSCRKLYLASQQSLQIEKQDN